ncbi:MAG: molecular chaperone HtpG [Oscillospiraceae bacterium]|nr:molecular chaperone HtpG [Oscillospiraceae bacterium]
MAKKQFKSESKRLLDLMINSIYTNKDIFLREIISNASDAIDKLCFKSLTDNNVGLDRNDFKIEVSANKDTRTLTVSDNGIGMDKEDLENNLGVIASSGSYKFKQEMGEKDKEDIDIIGQFGVGFYSAFMVAKDITVITKKYGSEQAYKWHSTGADGYTITECDKDAVGTDIIMILKDNTEEESYDQYLEQYKLSALIKKYSDYIRYPIEMEMKKSRIKEETKDSDKPEYEDYFEKETLNSMVPLWQKPKKDVTDEEYNQFYMEKFMDYNEPLKVISTSVEGVVTYKALLFIPSKTPYNYFTKEYKKGLQLYSSGVLIMDNCEELLPEHFRFVKGVVDSPDVSLNISREMLQQDRVVKQMAKTLEKKIKNELASMLKKDRESYEKFYSAFGIQLKYGCVADYGMNKGELQDLLMFYSGKEKKNITLKEYVDNMKENQKYIYFATGESVDAIDRLPVLELLKDNDFDILYLTDEVDEFCMQSLMAYNEKELRSVLNDDLGLPEENKEETEEEKSQSEGTVNFIKETLGEQVSDVVVSKKLKSYPVVLTAKGGVSFEMEKYFAQVNPEGGVKAQRVLEINPNHETIKAMMSYIDTDMEKAKSYCQLLLCQAQLMAGLDLDNTAQYSNLVLSLMK